MKATQKYVSISPRKLRLLREAVVGMPPEKALSYLSFTSKIGAEPLAKTIKSALSNAKTNFGHKESDLRFKEIQVNEGPTLKRWRAVSRGMAHRINKFTSHIHVVLEVINGSKS